MLSGDETALLGALAHGPMTTQEISEVVGEKILTVSRRLYQLLEEGAVKRVPMHGEITWALGTFTPDARPRPTIIGGDDTQPRVKRTAAERRALVLEALAEGPLSATALTASRQLSDVGGLLTAMQADGLVKRRGSGAKTLWMLSAYPDPVKVSRPPRHQQPFVTPPPSPAPPAESWWATPGITRDRWYEEARKAGDRLIASDKKKVPSA